jgi:hypothetical protein
MASMLPGKSSVRDMARVLGRAPSTIGLIYLDKFSIPRIRSGTRLASGAGL